MLKPFNKIIENKLTRTHDAVHFDVTPVKSTTYEFRHLDNSINEMMQRVKKSFLIEKEFITNVSHELQTPITILKSRFENMLVDENVPEDVAVKIDDSIKTLNRLSKIVKALLMISRIENEQYLKNETADIKEITDEIYEDIHERLNDKNITFYNNIQQTHIVSPANKSLIYTLLYNLIGNAIKYNVPNGTITLRNTSVNDKYSIEITDTGKGIAEENIPHIFERFRKFNNADEPSYGLGLAIVKTIAGFHHIEIQVESKELKGTTFRLVFK
ncbi:MAG: HAMP domain-containing histidine kinase [Bacteroidetes bacterium]|nr:HAMP domain-containing histidine kinase [Bacteroidota bacterium]